MGRLIELDKQYGNWNEIGGSVLENLATDDIEKRINPYRLKFNDDGEPDFEYEKETELGRAESSGFNNIWK